MTMTMARAIKDRPSRCLWGTYSDTTGAGAIVFRDFPEQRDKDNGLKFRDLHVPCCDVNSDATGIANATPHQQFGSVLCGPRAFPMLICGLTMASF